jgi:catechol 2,3-dioxygenase-like lactoylglutathione lyase family enzyme
MEATMDVKLGRLRQVAFSTRDLHKFVEFYRDVLGLELIAEFSPPGLAFFRLGETRLLVEQHAGEASAGAILYFEVERIDAVQAALEARGVAFSSQPHLIHKDDHGTFGAPGGEEWMTFFKDVDGNILALAERRPPSPGAPG